MQTKILLVDDHALLRKGLYLLLEEEPDLQVVGEAENGEMAIQQTKKLNPDVVIMDITMPGLNGIEATRQIIAENPDIRVLTLSIHKEKDFVDDMLEAGASGYILKETIPEELIEGIRSVQDGEVYLSAAITEIVIDGYRQVLTGKGDESALAPRTGTGPLLNTKLYPPPFSAGLIERSRLHAYIDRYARGPLTLICAPAGYGKSVLASMWVEENDLPSAWLSLDKHDNDLRGFLFHIVKAIQKPFPAGLPQMARLLFGTSLPSRQVLARILANELDQLPKRFILVLDDYHYIVDPSVHELMAELLRHPPERMHLMLVTRIDPPFDLLKFQARQQIGVVRARNLNFSVAETSALLHKRLGVSVNQEIAKRLTEKTEGWVTGLILTTIAVNDEAKLSSVSSILPGEQQTLDYLAAEALSHQTREMQAWLLRSAILDRFCSSLCEVVCKLPDDKEAFGLDGGEFIKRITKENIFVIPLDDRGQWNRYHHLFQELLLNQLGNVLDAEEIADLHMRASRWFAENAMVKDAIHHALAAGDPIIAAKILEQNRHAMLDEDKWHVLDHWLSLLPEDVKRQRPILLLTQVGVSLNQQNLVAMLDFLKMAEQALEQTPLDDPLWGEINYYKGYLNYFQGQGGAANKFQTLALDLLPQSAQFFRSEAKLHFALSLHMIGEKQRALKSLKDGLHKRHLTSNIRDTRNWAGLSFIHLLEGELTEVFHPSVQYQTIAASYDNEYVEGWALYMQACAYFFQMAQDKCIQLFTWISERRYIMQTRIAMESLCGLILLQQSIGQSDKATDTCQQIHAFAQETNDPANLLIAASCQARLSLMKGDLAPALTWLQTADLTADDGIMLWWIEIPRLTACRVLIAEGSSQSLREATDKLQAYLTENQTVHNTFQAIIIQTLLALAYHKQKQDQQALDVLNETLELAQPGQWIWPFIELGSPMEKLLKQLKKMGVSADLGHYIDIILAHFPSSAPPLPMEPQPNLINPLTERELQVLRLLTSALSAGEIAEELVVSVNTVRMHTKNIYSKLEVHSRIEAVECARQLGLI